MRCVLCKRQGKNRSNLLLWRRKQKLNYGMSVNVDDQMRVSVCQVNWFSISISLCDNTMNIAVIVDKSILNHMQCGRSHHTCNKSSYENIFIWMRICARIYSRLITLTEHWWHRFKMCAKLNWNEIVIKFKIHNEYPFRKYGRTHLWIENHLHIYIGFMTESPKFIALSCPFYLREHYNE